jgi:hypothetical protein
MAELAAAGMGIAGTVLSAFGKYREGVQTQKIYDANAKIVEQDAAWKAAAAKEEGYKLSRQRNEMIGEQAALYGASGLGLDTGSPLDVMAKTASEYERDIGFTGIAASRALIAGANQASIYKYAGKEAYYGGILGAGSTLLSGFGKAASIYSGSSGGMNAGF